MFTHALSGRARMLANTQSLQLGRPQHTQLGLPLVYSGQGNGSLNVLPRDMTRMARKSKWIEIRSPDEPAAEVARRAVEVRLALVWHYLPQAAEKADEDIEHVHQLRVATRRATAAMHLFERFLPDRRGRWFKKQLKRVRQAAGDARDLDVLIQRTEKNSHLNEPDRERLLIILRHHRQDAQLPIREVFARLRRRGYCQRLPKLLKKICLRPVIVDVRAESTGGECATCVAAAPPCEPTIRQTAEQNLAPLAASFFALSQAGFSDDAALHQFRIQGKQLRYALEVFAGALPGQLREEIYPRVVELQEQLGAINDHVTARTIFKAWSDDPAADSDDVLLLRRMVKRESSALQRARRKFLAWWDAERASQLHADLCRQIDVQGVGPSAKSAVAS